MLGAMITVKGLSFGFPGRALLANVSFDLQAGSVTCLLGGNGSGKTTLFNVLTGFLKPEQGAVHLAGVQLNGLPPYEISRLGLSRTFQDLRLIGKLTVAENVRLALPNQPGEQLGAALLKSARVSKFDQKADQRVQAVLEDYFLTNGAGQLASEISYGQQKLLTLACCAAMDARVVLLDEPVAGISPEYRLKIVEIVRRLKASGKAILLIEHQPDFIESVGDRFLMLADGRITSFDTFAELQAASVATGVLD